MKKFYRDEWEKFNKEYKRIFIGLLLVMFFLAIASYFFSIHYPNTTKKLINELVNTISGKGFKDLMGEDNKQKGTVLTGGIELKMFFLIFRNNLIAVSFIVFAGFFSYMIFPYLYIYFSLIINAVIVGIVLGYEKIQGGNPIKTLVYSILPHGITEFTSIILSATVSVFIGNQMYKSLYSLIKSKDESNQNFKKSTMIQEESQMNSKDKRYIQTIKTSIKKVGLTYLGVIVPLVFISAIIESFLTPHIMKWFM